MAHTPEEDYDLEEEIDRLAVTLSNTEVKAMDWAETITCAPRAIGIIGECLLLSSHSRAALVQLSDNRLRATSLPANLRQCARTGKDTFDEAQSRMRNISAQALMASKDGSGVVDRIMKFACKTQTAVVAKELERQKNNLKNVAAKCTKDAEELQLAFSKWKDETTILLQALEITEDQTVQKADKTATELLNTENLLETLKTELGFKGMDLKEIQERLAMRTEAGDASIAIGTPLIATGLILQLLGASMAAPFILGPCLAIWGRQALVGYTQMQRDFQVREIQVKTLEAENLNQMLQKLGSASCTIEDIRKVLGQAIKQLLDLQYQVSTLLNFFKAVFRQVDSIDSQMTHDLLDQVNEEGFREDEDIKKVLIENALTLKISFTFIGRLASMYSEISGKYLQPGMHKVQMIGLSDDSRTQAQIDGKREELENFKRESEDGVRRMTQEKQDQLNNDMARLIKEGILSMKFVTAQSSG